MTGFIKRLFGSKQNDEGSNAQPKPKKERPKAYFLDPDSAKTFGDIDYMRKVETVRKTFPKTRDNPKGSESVVEVSSIEFRNLSKAKPQPPTSAMSQEVQKQQESKTPQPETNSTERRRADSNLDAFRNMARDLRNKQ